MAAHPAAEPRARVPVAAVRVLAARGAGLRAAPTALAWLYLYSAMWLTAYTVVASLALGWTPVVITGASMEPRIARGDLVMLGEADQALGSGTVVTFQDPAGRGLVTHRVVETLPEGYRTRGDANASADSDVVPQAAVRGSGRLLIPLIGKPFVWLSNGELIPLAAWAAGTVAALALAFRRAEETTDGVAVVEPSAQRAPAAVPGVFVGPARDVLPQLPPRSGRLRVAW